ncbi:hypothetical protein [Devosia sp.]|uniref:hypothetical protein n=1 Tax=Devosia sp. TaxID=1871048 RepID=UPI0035B4093D
MRGIVGSILLGLLLSGVAGAAELPPEADRILWCGSAFYWLGNDASDAGEDAEADQFFTWADTLLLQATDLMDAAGIDDAAASDLVERYDAEVVDQMGKPEARHDVTACTELVGG